MPDTLAAGITEALDEAAARRAEAIANNLPRAYDLADHREQQRLFREVAGYLHTSFKHGTDMDGRRFALDAMRQIAKAGRTLAPE